MKHINGTNVFIIPRIYALTERLSN